MPVVTALEAHQRNNERVKLYLDDEFVMDLPLIQAASLRRGQCLTDGEIAALADAKASQSAYDSALRYLSYRPRSAEEARHYLGKKGVSHSVQEAVIERLQRHGYLDDVAFAEFWLADRERFKPMAARALRYELRQKGIADDIIEAQLTDIDAPASAYRAASGRVRRHRGRTRQVFRQKLSAFLRRRGFDFETINDVVLRLQRELTETEDGYFREEAAE